MAKRSGAACLERVLAFPCMPGAADSYRQAFRLSRRYEIHPYNAAIVAARKNSGPIPFTPKIFQMAEANYGGVPAEIQAELLGRLDLALRAEVVAFARPYGVSVTDDQRPSPRHISERDPGFQMKNS